MYKFTLASKFGDRVHISLQVWSLGLKYTLASNLGAKVYFILQYTLATTYTHVFFGFILNLKHSWEKRCILNSNCESWSFQRTNLKENTECKKNYFNSIISISIIVEFFSETICLFYLGLRLLRVWFKKILFLLR